MPNIEDVKEKLLELGEQEMRTYASEPEGQARVSVIDILLGEVKEQTQRVDVLTRDLYKVFNPVLKDKHSSSGTDESPQKDIGTYSPVGTQLKEIRNILKTIGNRLESITHDSETY